MKVHSAKAVKRSGVAKLGVRAESLVYPFSRKSTPARPRTTSKKGRVRSVCRVLGAEGSYLRAHARPARRVACAVCC